MKKSKILFLFILFCGILFAQKDKDYLELKSRYGFSVQRLAPASFNLYVDYRGPDLRPKVYLAVALQNDMLQFKKIDEHYEAEYQISFALRSKEQTLFNTSWQEKVSLKNFKETNSRRKLQYKSYELDGLILPSAGGHKKHLYNSWLEILDLVSHKTSHLKLDVGIKSISKDSLCFTDIGFFRGRPDTAQVLSLIPRTKSLAFNKPFFAMCRLNAAAVKAPVQASLQKKDKDKFVVIEETALRLLGDSAMSKVIYSPPWQTLQEGGYKLVFRYGKAHTEKEFNIIWFEKPIYLYKIDLALRPMQYLMSETQYDSVSGLSRPQLEKWFRAFWKRRDDTPSSAFNELLFEYYKRVDFCNHHFSRRSQEGWETDRGRIYLLYGEPQKIVNRRYSASTLPYLVWIYGDSLEFVFVDKNNSGEFYLIEDEKKE